MQFAQVRCGCGLPLRFPAAAAIIYVVFVITASVLMHVQGARSHDPRMELLRALEELTHALAHILR